MILPSETAFFDVGGVQTNFFNSVAGFRGRKMDLYEGGIRVPFLARWPSKIKAGTVSDVPSVQYDMMATLAQLTRQKAPVSDGISILPTLLGSPQTQASRPFMYFEYPVLEVIRRLCTLLVKISVNKSFFLVRSNIALAT